ncbi:MAG: beta-hydroxyacyl-ACP dehydratase [Bacteroidales bacterium]|nr:beta-hydroxyacyl-ACP dehydratase [Bacteroidales bacterium]
MRLIDDFFSINSFTEEGNDIVCKITLNKEHFIYKAHFPENPITPGVCIMQIVQEILEKKVNSRLSLKTLHNIKYLSIISPIENKELIIILNYSINEDLSIKVKGIIKSEESVFTKYSATYINNER